MDKDLLYWRRAVRLKWAEPERGAKPDSKELRYGEPRPSHPAAKPYRGRPSYDGDTAAGSHLAEKPPAKAKPYRTGKPQSCRDEKH